MSKTQKTKKQPQVAHQAQNIFRDQVKDAAKKNAKLSEARQATKTEDGFMNFTARIGANPSTQQNTISKGFYALNLVTRNRIQLEAAYRGSWIVGRAVDSVAEDMTKDGIELTTKDEEKVRKAQIAMKRLKIWQSLASVTKWSRLYGGAVGLIDIEGQDRSTPLNPETVGKGQFKGIISYDRWQIWPDLTNIIDEGPDMGLPAYYTITTNKNITDPTDEKNFDGGTKVHHSRLVRMVGHELPYFQAITEMMWGQSIIERVWDRLISFDSTTMSTASLVFRASLRSVKIDKLRDIVASGGPALEGLLAQMEMMKTMQDNEGLTLLDKEDEFAVDSYTFTGLDSVLLMFGQQVSGAVEIPLVRLFGQSPAGLNATGESDMRMYYDSINSKQETNLRNPLEMIITVLWRSEFDEARPDDLSFEFVPLWQMSATEKASIAKSNAETVAGAVDNGLMKRSTGMKELRQSAEETGMFGNITDEEIEDADTEAPPMPGESEQENSQSPLKPEDLAKQKAGDSVWKKMKRWLDGKSDAELDAEIADLLEQAEKADDQNNHHKAEQLRKKARELQKQKKKK